MSSDPGATEAPLVEVRDLHKEFTLGAVTVSALQGISLELRRGDFVAVTGPSGSGKSTLLNLIGGLDRATTGEVLVEGTGLSTLDENEMARYRRERVGFVFQSYNLIGTMTALQNVELPLMFAGVPSEERGETAVEALKRVGLGQRLTHRPTELSGGEQQRVAIARALINRPAIVLGDEPTGNLDSATGSEIMDLLEQTHTEWQQTLMMVTHDPEVAKYATRIVQIRDGRVVDEQD